MENTTNEVAQWGSKQIIRNFIATHKFEGFTSLSQVGEGTFGKVYKCKNNASGEIVALKRISMESETEGFPITAFREIKILRSLQHKNIVSLQELVVCAKGKFHMVFEWMDHDLFGLINDTERNFKPSLGQVKCWFQQLMEGLQYLHSKDIIHRDLKSSNLLVDNKGQLKIADFGLSRFIREEDVAARTKFTNRVVTLWYRPPELLLGADDYRTEIDIWSAGCILIEKVLGKCLMRGASEVEQINSIWEHVGTPNAQTWPKAFKYPHSEVLIPKEPKVSRLRQFLSRFPTDVSDLVEKMLQLNPDKRLNASQVLEADFFWNSPSKPCSLAEMPSFATSSHEMTVKMKRDQSTSIQQQQQQSQKRHKPQHNTNMNNNNGPNKGHPYASNNTNGHYNKQQQQQQAVACTNGKVEENSMNNNPYAKSSNANGASYHPYGSVLASNNNGSQQQPPSSSSSVAHPYSSNNQQQQQHPYANNNQQQQPHY